MKAILVILFLSITFCAQAQDMSFQKRQYEWPNRPDLSTEVVAQFKEEPIVILSEDSEWTLIEREGTCLFEKRFRVKFQTEEAAENYQLSLPEPMDPSREYFDIPVIERADKYRPKLWDMDMIYCTARLIKSDGRVLNKTASVRVEQEEYIYDQLPHKMFAYHFKWEDLEVGDVLEVAYKFYLPNWITQTRFFIHGYYPKQKVDFKFTYPLNELFIFKYANGGAPTHTYKTKKRPRTLSLQWQWNNIAAALSEEGARLYQDLPNISYYRHNKLFGQYENDRIATFEPYTWEYMTLNFLGNEAYNRYRTKRKLSSKEEHITRFYNYLTAGKNTSIEKLSAIHNHINQEFTYLSDKKYMEGYGWAFERLPFHLKQKKLRRRSRVGLYYGLLSRLKEDFNLVWMADKRVGYVDNQAYWPIEGKWDLFSMQEDNSLYYLYPKMNRHGYYINEFPFYLEGSNALNIGQMTTNRFEEEVLYFGEIPLTPQADNYRKSVIEVAVNSNKESLKFNANVELSGQFSTLTRPIYQYGSIDSTIHLQYNHKISDIAGSQIFQIPETNIQVNDKVAPYTFIFEEKYGSNELITKEGETYSILIADWFRHRYDRLNADSRSLPYYPDFAHTDSYEYILNFEQAIQLEQYDDLPLLIENDYASYEFDIQQLDSYKIKVRSVIQLKKEVIPLQSIDKIAAIYEYIHQLANAEIRYKLQANNK